MHEKITISSNYKFKKKNRPPIAKYHIAEAAPKIASYGRQVRTAHHFKFRNIYTFSNQFCLISCHADRQHDCKCQIEWRVLGV